MPAWTVPKANFSGLKDLLKRAFVNNGSEILVDSARPDWHTDIVHELMSGVRDGVIFLDHELRIVSWNAKSVEYLSTHDAPSGMPVRSAILAQYSGILDAALASLGFQNDSAAWRQDTTADSGAQIISITGKLLTCESGGSPAVMLLIAGDDRENIGINSDARSLELLAELEIFRSNRQLARVLIHDINNSLATTLGYLFLSTEILKKENQSKLPEFLNMAQTAGASLRELVASVQKLNRGSEDATARSSLGEAVKATLQLIDAALPANIKLETDLVYDPPSLQVVQGDVGRILVCLMKNATEAMNDRGNIHVRMYANHQPMVHCITCGEELQGNYCVLSVEDTGAGVPIEIASDIFAPLYTTKDQGSGMGLYLVDRLTHSCAGHVVLQQDQGSGAKFRLYFKE